jgi:hypothetical protein
VTGICRDGSYDDVPIGDDADGHASILLYLCSRPPGDLGPITLSGEL